MTSTEQESRRPQSICLAPLSNDDVAELLEVFEERAVDSLTIGPQAAGEFRAGDPATIAAVVLVSTTAIAALTAFLLKRRRKSKVDYSLSVEYPDGTKIQETLRIEASDAAPPDPQVIQQLTRLAKVDPGDVEKLLE
jgi:hypothetical protein